MLVAIEAQIISKNWIQLPPRFRFSLTLEHFQNPRHRAANTWVIFFIDNRGVFSSPAFPLGENYSARKSSKPKPQAIIDRVCLSLCLASIASFGASPKLLCGHITSSEEDTQSQSSCCCMQARRRPLTPYRVLEGFGTESRENSRNSHPKYLTGLEALSANLLLKDSSRRGEDRQTCSLISRAKKKVEATAVATPPLHLEG